MTSPTPNKGMTYPGHGLAVGAWDQPLNTNFDQLDLNLGGGYPITILTTAVGATYNTSGANISSTVATVTFPTSLAQNLYYNFTGTQTQNVTLTYPAVGSIYVIGNNSSGAFTLAASVGTANTASLTQGGQTIVVTDPSGAYPAQNVFADVRFNSITVSTAALALGTGFWGMPSGTTAQRSSSPTAGYYRFNTDFKQAEIADGNNWRQVPVGQPIAAGYKNLRIQNSGTASPDTQVNLTADAVTVESTAGTAYRLRSVNTTITSSINGANGLDAGGLANGTWYAIYTIYSSSSNTVAGLLSAQFSSSSVTMPAGYDAQARFGAIITTGSAHFNRVIQYNHTAQYVVTIGSTTIALPTIASGGLGDINIPTWTAAAVANYVPTTASEILLAVSIQQANTSIIVAPSSSYGAYNSATNPPPVVASATPTLPITLQGTLTLESSNIYVASGSSSSRVQVLGWIDNI